MTAERQRRIARLLVIRGEDQLQMGTGEEVTLRRLLIAAISASRAQLLFARFDRDQHIADGSRCHGHDVVPP